jgi:transcriptional regulator of acetoin/glycerol metabolism
MDALLAEEWGPLSEIEGRYVTRVLAHTGGNKQAAARLLEIDRKTLDRMIKRHKIPIGNGAKFPSQVRVTVGSH